MNETLASGLVTAWAVYSAIGLLFGLWFVVRGVARIDPTAADGSKGFRLLILPGVVAFWPLLALRVARGVTAPPDECNAHRAAAAKGEHA